MTRLQVSFKENFGWLENNMWCKNQKNKHYIWINSNIIYKYPLPSVSSSKNWTAERRSGGITSPLVECHQAKKLRVSCRTRLAPRVDPLLAHLPLCCLPSKISAQLKQPSVCGCGCLLGGYPQRQVGLFAHLVLPLCTISNLAPKFWFSWSWSVMSLPF